MRSWYTLHSELRDSREFVNPFRLGTAAVRVHALEDALEGVAGAVLLPNALRQLEQRGDHRVLAHRHQKPAPAALRSEHKRSVERQLCKKCF